MSRWIVFCALLAMACGGGGASSGGGGGGGGGDGTGPDTTPKSAPDPNAQFAALEYGADYASWTKMNTEQFWSKPHGKRMVDVYVNDIGAEAFKDEAREMEFPVGSIVVKTSVETKDKVPTDVAGPIFVMVKKEAGFDPEHADWWYGLHWENVPSTWQKQMGGPQVYWRTPSSKVNYCWKCHQNYPRHIGGVPKKFRSWEQPE